MFILKPKCLLAILASNARADGCVLPWVRECEAITDKQSCKNADCTWESSRRGGGEHTINLFLCNSTCQSTANKTIVDRPLH